MKQVGLAKTQGSLKPRIYIASKFFSRKRLMPVRQQLESLGFIVLSSWMLEDPDESANADSLGDDLEHSQYMAERDHREVDDCHVFIIDTSDESNTGGRDVELGWAQKAGKICYRVGPIRNVFHSLVPAHKTWIDLINHLRNVYGITGGEHGE